MKFSPLGSDGEMEYPFVFTAPPSFTTTTFAIGIFAVTDWIELFRFIKGAGVASIDLKFRDVDNFPGIWLFPKYLISRDAEKSLFPASPEQTSVLGKENT